MESSTLLREAIVAVKAGQRQYARELFLELIELDPVNETAWIWLSGLLESREDQIIALENSVIIDKGGPNLEARLHPLSDTDFAPEVDAVRAALSALEAGHRAKGKALLEQIVAANPDHERAWIALADLESNNEKQIVALEQVLRINPNNFKAREKLNKAQHLLYENFLARGRILQQQGDLQQALVAYKSAEKYASTGSFKAAARQRWELVERQSADPAPENPNVTLLRLALGPPFVFALFLLIQSGLKPWQLSPFLLYCFGGLMVTVGSLLAAGSSRVPYHPIWVRFLGPQGLTDPGHKSLIRGIGILMILVPFVLWLLLMAQRLDLISPIF